MAVTLTGKETLQVLGQYNNQPAATTLQCATQDIANLANAGNVAIKISNLNTGGAGTITAAMIYGKIVARGGTQSATAFTDTTDTAANIIALLPSGVAFGDAVSFTYENTTNAPATITGTGGVTVSGITVVPANSTVKYLLTYTAAATITMAGYEAGLVPVLGTFLAGGASATFAVTNAQVSPNSIVGITMKTLGGTVTKAPFVSAITAGTSFTVSYGTADVSLYSYSITY